MEIFEYILVILIIVLASNIIHSFLPHSYLPIIQISLGVIVSLFSKENEFYFDSELFFVLIISPLIFMEGFKLNKKDFKDNFGLILSLSMGLVFFVVFVLGFIIHWLLPISLALSFVLSSSLAPTDSVAIKSLAERFKYPSKIKHILESETILNDASGVIAFNYALIAVATGYFSITSAFADLIFTSIFGVLFGVTCSILKKSLEHLLRERCSSNLEIFTLLEIISPFFIYIMAEELHINGILAVASFGMMHSIKPRLTSAPRRTFNQISKSNWDLISFVLNGAVFIIFGSILPNVFYGVVKDNKFTPYLIFVIVLITLLLIATRYIWISIVLTKNKDTRENRLIYTFSGVRGTITLATIMSVPMILNNNTSEERNLVIFIIAGVILLNLIISSIALDKLIGGRSPYFEDLETARKIVYNKTIDDIGKINEDTYIINLVKKAYIKRLNQSSNDLFGEMRKKHLDYFMHAEYELNKKTFNQYKQTKIKLDKKAIDEGSGLYLLYTSSFILFKTTKNPKYLFEFLKYFAYFLIIGKRKIDRDKINELRVNSRKEYFDSFGNDDIRSSLMEITSVFELNDNDLVTDNMSADLLKEKYYNLIRISMEIERNAIQNEFNNRDISINLYKKLKYEMLFLENQYTAYNSYHK